MTKRVEGLVAKWRQEVQDRRYQAPLDRIAIRHAQELELALVADRSEAGELPELPPYGIDTANHASVRVRGYTADQLLACGPQCARAASCGGGIPVAYRLVNEDGKPCPAFGQWIEAGYWERCGAIQPVIRDGWSYEYAYTTPPTPSAGVEVTDSLRSLLWNIVDNLNDTPVNKDWAERTAKALTAALEGGK